MLQFRRSLFLAKSPLTLHRFLCPFMFKLQKRMLQNSSGVYFAGSPFAYIDRIGKLNSTIVTVPSKVGRSERFGSALPLGSGVFNYCKLHCCSSNYGASWRSFSSKANGKGNSDDSVRKYEQLWERAKALAAKRKKMAACSAQASASEGHDVVTTSDHTSQETKSSSAMTGRGKQVSKDNSPNGSLSLKGQFNNKKKKFNGKVKSVKESNGSLHQDKADIEPSRDSLANKSDKVKSKGKRKAQPKPTTTKIMKPLYPPTGKSVVVVESLTKAKVIQGYLGDEFEVLASHGHVRDLAARSGSVRPNDDFNIVWEVPSGAWTHLKTIEVALSSAQNLILSSDPDCEGETVAWHIVEMLKQQNALREHVTVARVVFHEISEASIRKALQTPKEIDLNLVHAYLARRALDYLIGFNISPILWKKLPGCRSAGRIQSVALSLISEREMEIDEFKPKEYWTVDVEFKKKELGFSMDPLVFASRLTYVDSKKLNQFSVRSKAVDIEQKINSANFQVVNSKTSQVRKNPPPPFITSTLQQEAANTLHFSATHTMKLAQKLYEGVQLSDGTSAGLITYIGTDGLHISDEAVKDIRNLVTERYGPNFASESAQNAQGAHEAIRPTDIRRLPSMLMGLLDEDALRLYALIWARTMACQMEPVILDQIQLDIADSTNSITFQSSCTKVGFLGYQAVYKDMEEFKSKENEDYGRVGDFEILNSLKLKDPVYISTVDLKEHKTQPPPRYTEGSLVKKLEELGIGRPSTYASTLRVLQERNYVTVKGCELYPEFRGRMVSAFLSHHFSEVSDYSFTADLETKLDNVSTGLTGWKGLLNDYWTRFSLNCAQANHVPTHQVEKLMDNKFSKVVFSSPSDRECPSCTEGTMVFKLSEHGDGYYICCDQYPSCRYSLNMDEDIDASSIEEPVLIGLKPNSNEKILLRKGPYGFYVQLGETKKGFTPKRAPIPPTQIKDVSKITVEDALELLTYPKTFGSHPKDGKPVIIKISNSGFSLKHGRTVVDIPKKLKPEDLTMEKVTNILTSKKAKQIGRRKFSKLEEY